MPFALPDPLSALALGGAVLWLAIWLLPWRPWGVRETLAGERADGAGVDLADVDVLIPARDEAAVISTTLHALRIQGEGLRVLVVDDQSTDGTAGCALAAGLPDTRVIRGGPLPDGWSGKVWALAQGEAHLERPLVLLLDADIELAPGLLAALRRKMVGQGAQCALVSLMAELPMATFSERLLLPTFIYYFKLLYPFALANAPRSRVAAAAGGCVLLRRDALQAIGGFQALRGALIDDCTLARLVKGQGFGTWTGLSRDLRSRRPSGGLRGIWSMVARNAYTQLGYSPLALLGCTLLMVVAYAAPVVALLGSGWCVPVALATWGAMALNLLPTLRFYSISAAYAPLLPLAAVAYLAMTWTSAVQYWCGRRSRWKARDYAVK